MSRQVKRNAVEALRVAYGLRASELRRNGHSELGDSYLSQYANALNGLGEKAPSRE